MNGRLKLKRSKRGCWVTYSFGDPWKTATWLPAGRSTPASRDCDGFWLPQTQRLQTRWLGVWLNWNGHVASRESGGAPGTSSPTHRSVSRPASSGDDPRPARAP